MLRSIVVFALSLTIALLATAGGAVAGITPISHLRQVTTFATLTPATGASISDFDSQQSEELGVFDGTAASAVGEAGDEAHSAAFQLSYINSSSLLAEGNFNGAAHVETASFAEAFGASRVIYRFAVDAATPFHMDGGIRAAGNGTVLVSLVREGVGVTFYRSLFDSVESIDLDGELSPGNYELALQTSGYGQASGAFIHPASGGFSISITFGSTSVAGFEPATASMAVLPNPIRDTATIHYGASRAGGVPGILIYDVEGRLMRRLDVSVTSGEVAWDTRDQSGRPVSPGIYYIRAASGHAPALRAVVLR